MKQCIGGTRTVCCSTVDHSELAVRNIRVDEDLVDQLFNSSEKRLARTLLLLARYGKEDKPKECSQKYRKRCWPKWSAPRGRA